MLLSKFKIKGHSMEPFLKKNEIVLVSSVPFIFSKPKIGDVVIFKFENKFSVKRITKVKSSFAKVSEDKYFLRGDNVKDSLDSRRLGWLNRKDIMGKVIYKTATSH